MFAIQKAQTANPQAGYAQREDFCEVFEKNMEGLYKLAFLLTANREDAERCFVSAINESFQQTRVFKDWAFTWVKRCVIRTAIEMVFPGKTAQGQRRQLWSATRGAPATEGELEAVTRLAPLERFVFVMVVLERYSVWDCALMLGVSMKSVASAQIRALRVLPSPEQFAAGAEARQAVGQQVPA